MILDGYTEEHEINGVAILLRPFTRHERPLIGQMLDGLSDVMAHRTERKLVLSRVVDCDGDVDELYGEELWELAMGVNNTAQEIADETNLSDGVFLVTRYPWLERTTCDQCRQWLWNPLTGQLHCNAGEPPLKRQGEPPCEPLEDLYCPRGHWRKPLELSPKNKMAWAFYKACEATGIFPNDPLARRNVSVIRASLRRASNAEGYALADQQTNGRATGGSRQSGQLRHAQAGRVRATGRSA